jgi:hypothetical protein
MPHVSEYRVQPDHAGHDRLLVAALAAGDLAGTDRDHALDLTRSCSACAELHDDLVAIARATAVVPPPVAARPRDFQLTPADAARLRRAGLRQFVPSLGAARLGASRQLGVGLAALGLVGLLIGNTPLLPLGSASSPAAGSAGLAAPEAGGNPPATTNRDTTLMPVAAGSAPAASAAAAGNIVGTTDAASPAASGDDRTAAEQAASPAPQFDAGSSGTGAGSAGGPKAIASQAEPNTLSTGVPPGEPSPFRPLNVVFALAVLAGLAILVRSAIRGRTRS